MSKHFSPFLAPLFALGLVTAGCSPSSVHAVAAEPASDPAELWRVVDELHSGFVMDLHTDTLLIVEALGYDFGKRHWAPLGFMPWMGHVDIPRAREAGLDALFLGIVANPIWGQGPAQVGETLRVAHEAVLDRYPDQIALARSVDEIVALKAQGKIAVQFLLEGAHGFGDDPERALELLDEWYALGLRVVGFAHFTDNGFAASSASSKPERPGLSEAGKLLVRRMNELGIAVDLAHAHPESFRDILAVARAPVLVSHTGVAARKNVFRNVQDWQIRAVARTGGVIGVMFAPTWLSTDMLPPISAVVEHMKHIKDLVGAEHIALGSDYDGFIWLPRGMRDVTDLPKLTAALLAAGFTREEVSGILGGNTLRVLREIENRARVLSGSPARPE